MKSYYFILTIVVLTLFTSACNRAQSHFDNQPHLKSHIPLFPHHTVVNAVSLDNGSYAYSQKNNNTNEILWYYIWFSSSNSSSSNGRYYGNINNFYSSPYSPSQMGHTLETKTPPIEIVEKDNKIELGEEVKPEGETAKEEQSSDQQIAQENIEIDHENQSAIENFENEGGAISPPIVEEPAQSQPAESSPSSSSSSESSSSSSSDSGGSGGDGGGGGGGD